MKRFWFLITCLALTLAAAQVVAHEEAQKAEAKSAQRKAPAPTTITGELVDTGCYLAHAARGAKHVDCATKCIANGMPMGVLTKGGALYLVTLNHDNPDPYNALKAMAGKNVSVTGVVMTRAGMKGIDVSEARPVEESAAK